MTCPRCGAALTPGDRFCSECGARVAPAEPPVAGSRAEAPGPGLAGHTDPGVTHAINQDAFALSGPAGGGAGTLMVLCDGVSNSQTPELAAATAARVAHDALTAARAAGAEPGAAMAVAVRAAHNAVCALPFDRQAPLDPPATTLVAAWVDADGVTLGWLGDSRAYALPSGAGAGRQLTRDHSWLALVLDRGDMPEAEARRDPRAHALVHCLGTLDFSHPSPCPEPGVMRVAAPDPAEGWLLLCSDGLWNYAETPGALQVAANSALGGDAAGLCRRLVDFARRSGGRDNITVLAARWREGG